MVEIGMSLEYRVAIAQLYEQVRYQLKIENGFVFYIYFFPKRKRDRTIIVG